ncbi:hypothetical protein MTO96_025463 [Rhipicephalus appendiculatus]
MPRRSMRNPFSLPPSVPPRARLMTSRADKRRQWQPPWLAASQDVSAESENGEKASQGWVHPVRCSVPRTQVGVGKLTAESVSSFWAALSISTRIQQR